MPFVVIAPFLHLMIPVLEKRDDLFFIKRKGPKGYFYYKGKFTRADGLVFEGKFSFDLSATGTLVFKDGRGCEVVCGEIVDKDCEKRTPEEVKLLLKNHKEYFDKYGYKKA